MAADSKPYAAAWRSFRERRRRFWLFYVGYVPFAVALVSLLCRFVGPDLLFLVIAVPWFVISLALLIPYRRFDCPRCGQLFFMKGLLRNGYVRRCLHCGLPKWSEYSPGEPDI